MYIFQAIKAALEWNTELRKYYVCTISLFDPDQLVFGDKSTANKQVENQQRVWGPKRGKVINALPFSKGETFSILPVFIREEFLCQDIMQGSFTSVMFFYFVQNTLLPYCNPYPVQYSVIVMDNCQIYQHPLIHELSEEASCKLIILPPYSPNYNPIEYTFSVMKKWISHHHIEFAETIVQREMDLFFPFAMLSINYSQAHRFFKCCRYE